MIDRRQFLKSTIGAAPLLSATSWSAPAAKTWPSLEGELGVTTGSFMRHLAAGAQDGKLRLLDLPRRMRDELDMRVIDLMTATLVSLEPDYLDKLRDAADR